MLLAVNSADAVKFTAKSSPRCFLYGVAKSADTSKKNKFGALQDILRMDFEANNATKCEKMISSYCRNNLLAKGQEITKLDAYFRPSPSKHPIVRFEISPQCAVTRTIDSDSLPES